MEPVQPPGRGQPPHRPTEFYTPWLTNTPRTGGGRESPFWWEFEWLNQSPTANGQTFLSPPLKLWCCVTFCQQPMPLGALSQNVSFLFLLPITLAAKPNPLVVSQDTSVLPIPPAQIWETCASRSLPNFCMFWPLAPLTSSRTDTWVPHFASVRTRSIALKTNEHMDSGLFVLLHSKWPQTELYKITIMLLSPWGLWVKNSDRAQSRDLSLLHWYLGPKT